MRGLNNEKRYALLDSLRGLLLLEMIVYHFFWTWCIYLSRICPGFIAVCVIGGSKVFAGVLFFYQGFAGL